tara:strand:+ start:10457 stop:11164 length:708 start_codon:yes stop_codon:yes gene_type:complete
MTTNDENIELEKKEIANKEEKATNTETKISQELQVYNKKQSIWTDRRIYHDFCMVINYMIISATLLMLTYFLYNLTDEIRQFDVDDITNGIDSVNKNLDGINKFGYTFTKQIEQIEQFDSSSLQNFDITNFNKLINKMNQTLFNFDINKLNTLIDSFLNSRISEFDIDDLNKIVIQINQTIFNLNNAIQNVRPAEITQQYIESATDITPPIPTNSPTTSVPQSQPTPPTSPNIGF